MIKIHPAWIVLIVIACASVLCGWWMWRLVKNLGDLSADEKRVRLLYKTDHEALLKACRSLMAQKHSNSLNMDYWYVTEEDGEIYRIDDNFREAGLPEVIVKLDPVFIYIYIQG